MLAAVVTQSLILSQRDLVASVALLGMKGYVWWHLTVPLAVANILGSLLGTWMALRYGAGFVRWIFVAVVSVLIARSAWDAFLR